MPFPLPIVDNDRPSDANAKNRIKIENLEPELRTKTFASPRPFFLKLDVCRKFVLHVKPTNNIRS